MTTIYNHIASVGGYAQDDIKVQIQLSWDTTVSPFPRVGGATPTSYEGDLIVRTDEDGRWTATIAANDTILPTGSLYKVTETEGTTVRAIYYINVLTDSNEVWVGNVLTGTPAWEV